MKPGICVFEGGVSRISVDANSKDRTKIWLVAVRLILAGWLSVLLFFGSPSVQAQDVYAENFSNQNPNVAPRNYLHQQPNLDYANLPSFSTSDPLKGPEASALAGNRESEAHQQPDKKKENEEKKKRDALKKKAASAHKPLFFDNDFSYLSDESFNDFLLGDSLKQRCLPRGGSYDIGGQFRMRAQFEQNMRGLGLTGVDDSFLLYRTRIYGDFRLNPIIRFYAEMIDAESNYEQFSPRPIEVNRTDMLNLFVDAKLIDNDNGGLTMRVGTQELLYGAQRVVSPLDWANTRRTFQGVKGIWKGNQWDIDAFWTNPMRIDDTHFDSPDRDREFMGTWSTYKGVKDQTIDLYALRYLNGRGSNNFKYNTLGGRWSGLRDQMLWELQAGYQFGENTDGSDHAAGMATMGIGRKFEACWKPIMWLYYDYASGDNDLGAGNGYDQSFPLAHKYLGFMDLFGRQNIEDVNLQVSAQPTDRLKLLMWYHYLFLATPSDSPYSVVGTPFNASNLPGSADLGHEIDFLASYKISLRQNLLFGYSHFFSGDYYDLTPGVPFNGDADFFYTQWTVNF